MKHNKQLIQLDRLAKCAVQVMMETPKDTRQHFHAAIARQQFLVAMALECVEAQFMHKGKLTKAEQKILTKNGEEIVATLRLIKGDLWPFYQAFVDGLDLGKQLLKASEEDGKC